MGLQASRWSGAGVLHVRLVRPVERSSCLVVPVHENKLASRPYMTSAGDRIK